MQVVKDAACELSSEAIPTFKNPWVRMGLGIAHNRVCGKRGKVGSGHESAKTLKYVKREAERILKETTGYSHSASSVDRNNVGAVKAMFIPGRGGELSFDSNFSKGIRFHTGENAKLSYKDPFQCLFSRYPKKANVAQGFAYKAIWDPNMNWDNETPTTRFYVHNVFRHTFNGINNLTNFGPNTTAWNTTLGPGTSVVRLPPPDGSYQGSSTTPVFSSGLLSPYRYPQIGDTMWTEFNRVPMENIMWNMNPFKFRSVASQEEVVDFGGTAPLILYGNAKDQESLDHIPDLSFPAQQPKDVYNVDKETETSCFYKCQSGLGNVAYQFANDGTAAVVVDVVITRVTRGKYGNPLQMTGCYEKGYMNMMYASSGSIALQGEPYRASDVTMNAKCEFLPASALKWYNKDQFTGTHPYKQVGRDQFIIPAGSVRPWSFALQSMDYDARNYPGNPYTVDDLSYIVSIGFSTVSVPLVELPVDEDTGARAVIDRRPTALNVGVTGTYKETVYPVYLDYSSKEWNINGVLNKPYYQNPFVAADKIGSSNIADMSQVIRSSDQTTALIKVGTFGQGEAGA